MSTGPDVTAEKRHNSAIVADLNPADTGQTDPTGSAAAPGRTAPGSAFREHLCRTASIAPAPVTLNTASIPAAIQMRRPARRQPASRRPGEPDDPAARTEGIPVMNDPASHRHLSAEAHDAFHRVVDAAERLVVTVVLPERLTWMNDDRSVKHPVVVLHVHGRDHVHREVALILTGDTSAALRAVLEQQETA